MATTIAMNDLSNKQSKLVAIARLQALEANEVLFKHGSVAVSGGKILAKGFSHPRTKIRSRFVCTFHAEIDVISQLLRGSYQRSSGDSGDSCEEQGQQNKNQAKGAVGDAVSKVTQISQAA